MATSKHTSHYTLLYNVVKYQKTNGQNLRFTYSYCIMDIMVIYRIAKLLVRLVCKYKGHRFAHSEANYNSCLSCGKLIKNETKEIPLRQQNTVE